MAVTLDDGFLDALDNAAPILVDLGIPATFFVSTDRLHEEHETWQDILAQILFSESPLPSLLTIPCNGRTLNLPTATKTEREKAFEKLNEFCWNGSFEVRTNIIARICSWSGLALRARKTHRVMTADEIRQLSEKSGLSIGCHGIHHLCLPTQPLPIQQREAVESKYVLESLLKKPITSFSYPFGEYDNRTSAVVREAGFSFSFTTHEGLIYPCDDMWRLSRNEVGPWSPDRFAEKMDAIFSVDKTKSHEL